MVGYVAQVLVFVGIYCLLAAGENVLLGLGGIFFLAPAAYFGMGAYAAARIAIGGAPFPLALLGGAAAGAGLALVTAFYVGRLRGDAVVIGTFALQLVATDVFQGWKGFTGGNYGLFGIPRPSVFGMAFDSVESFAGLVIVCAALGVLLCWRFRVSDTGLAVRAHREDELVAVAAGLRATRTRSTAFILSGALAGLGGALYGMFTGYVDPTAFDINATLTAVAIAIVGGLGSSIGVAIGSIILISFPEALQLVSAKSDWIAQLQLLVYGALILAVLMFRPAGLIPERPSIRMRARPGREGSGSREGARTEAVVGLERLAEGRSLRAVGLDKRFGGVKAVADVTLSLDPGKVTAIIGPNGAGKSTVINLVSGYLKSDRGTVRLGDEDISRKKPEYVSRLGVSRTFQDARFFPKLTVYENVAASLLTAGLSKKDVETRVRAGLATFDLMDVVDQRASDLAYAQQKLLMMACAVARQDAVLLLDEVAAGLDHSTVDRFAGIIREIAAAGRTVCVVEHNLAFVWKVSDEVVVMANGSVLTKGTAEEIRNNEVVRGIYFGRTPVDQTS